MKFNGSKFEVIRYGTNKEIKENTLYFTPNQENVIEEKETLRDLGVILSSNMKFSEHIDKITATVNKKMGWILRTFRSRDTFFMKLLWKQLLQPHVDYCSQLYFNGQSSDLDRLENLQRTYTRKIYEVRNLDYWARLRALRLNSQERRFERYRILYTWKVIEGLVPNCGISTQTSERNGRFCEIRKLNRNASQRVQTLKENSFNINGPMLFNSLPKKIRQISKCSVDQFKAKLDEFLSKVPDQPKTPSLVPEACNQFTAKPSNSLMDQMRRMKNNQGG